MDCCSWEVFVMAKESAVVEERDCGVAGIGCPAPTPAAEVEKDCEEGRDRSRGTSDSLFSGETVTLGEDGTVEAEPVESRSDWVGGSEDFWVIDGDADGDIGARVSPDPADG